jgi:serine/threonine-protein kinase PknG
MTNPIAPAEPCRRWGCSGSLEDGYCNVCGFAAVKHVEAVSSKSLQASSRSAVSAVSGTGSSPISRSAAGSRRSSRSSSRSMRKQLGAGLVTLPDLPSLEPERAILPDPRVPERKRFCARCDQPLKREFGFCGKCGSRYSFVPSLKPGDMVANQYEVRGAIAFGGLGWIYLALDKLLSRYVVLKGLLNTQDESAAAAALAERQFLAAVKHPNIVSIYNFVQAGSEGFIVMEYVGGKTLKQIRQERGPLPPAEAIAYIHRILSAFAYLHRQGMVYCDFKPDNVMLEKDDVKLIDLGGVRRIDDAKGDIYGTVGYSAPEAGEGPTPASDLFTVGRSLTVLLCDIKGFNSEHRYTLPTPEEEPRFARRESLYRCLLKATAHAADDRFESADEMAEQLLGVLRELVAVESGTPRPGISHCFGPDLLALEAGNEMQPVVPDYRQLPIPLLDMDDVAAQAVSSAMALADPARRVAALRGAAQQSPKSREARLRLAAALIDSAEFNQAATLLKALADEDAWDWRVLWYQGRRCLAQGRADEARKCFDQLYFDLPGELAPKLGLGLATELCGELALAAGMYDIVGQTDPAFVSAVFGLARCLFRQGDRKAAVAALHRIPPSSALSQRARVEAARLLVRTDVGPPALDDLASASMLAEGLPLSEQSRAMLSAQIFSAAVQQVSARAVAPSTTTKILGQPLEERSLRAGLERSLRAMARFAEGEERIKLIDQANSARPRTLV